MSMRTLWGEIRANQGFAFDFECVDSQGEPTTDALAARPTLLSVASGKTRAKVETYDWNDETRRFLRFLLMQEQLTAVAHYGIYDYAVAHWSGCLDIREAKATMMDTMLLAWLVNEEDDLGLKELVFTHLGYRMTTFGAAQRSPFYVKARQLEAQQETVRKEVAKEIRRLASAAKKQIVEMKREVRATIKGKKAQDEEISKRADTINWEAERAAEAEDRGLDQRLLELQGLAEEQRRIGDQEFRKYAADDAKQTWRLYKCLLTKVKHLNVEKWLPVEIENYKRAIFMHIDGVFINQQIAQRLVETTRPLIDEFRAEVFDLAKQEFNLNSPEQMARVLYNDLGIEPPAATPRLGYEKLKDAPWAFSASTEVLERISHPIAQAILNFRALDTLDKNFLSGLPQQAKDDPLGRSRIHAVFKSMGTVTGRWSSATRT